MNENADSRNCFRCGATLDANAPEGLCPRCLMALNLTAPTEKFGSSGTKVLSPNVKCPSLAEIAAQFPQFEILDFLGRGGMGFVYKARQPKLDRFVALKILVPEAQKGSRFPERFQREAQALAKLNHPNIVAVHDFGENGGLYFLIMEFVDGVNLRELLQTQKMKPEEALAIVPHICDALQFAHSQGIVHRDIKPENILLDKQGRVKIADFGIAKILGTERKENLTGDAQAIGTPHYMAPEQVEKPATVDHRADIYSLGVVFYEMLTGELPLGKFQPPSRKVQVDVRLDEIVLHALEKEPERRYQHASEVKTDVETIVTTTSESAAKTGSPPKVSLCYVSTPEYLRTFRGRFLNIFQGEGELHLDGETLRFIGGWQGVTIPLSAIRSLARGCYPTSAKPVPLDFIAVTFSEHGVLRTLLFTPVRSYIMSPWEANKVGAEWMVALQEAVQSRTGKKLPIEQSKAGQEMFWPALMKSFLFSAAGCTAIFALIPLVLEHRLPNRWSELMWGPLVPVISFAGLLLMRWMRRGPFADTGDGGEPDQPTNKDARAKTTSHLSQAEAAKAGSIRAAAVGVGVAIFVIIFIAAIFVSNADSASNLGIGLFLGLANGVIASVLAFLVFCAVKARPTRRLLRAKAALFFLAAACFFVAAFSFPPSKAIAVMLSLAAVVGFGIAGYRHFLAAMAQGDPGSKSASHLSEANAAKLYSQTGFFIAVAALSLLLPAAAIASGLPPHFFVPIAVLCLLAIAVVKVKVVARAVEPPAGTKMTTDAWIVIVAALLIAGGLLAAGLVTKGGAEDRLSKPTSAVADSARVRGTAGATTFEQVVETVLKKPERRVAELLDLDTGRRATSSTFGGNDRETHVWIREQKVDLLGAVEKGQIGVLCMDMVVVPGASNGWEMITADAVKTNWHLAQGEPKPITAISPVTDQTDTWLFLTREDGRGVLQILGGNENPPGVKIRYKRLEKTESSNKDKAVRFEKNIVEDLALQMLVAIREKDDATLKSLATDRVKGWRNALPKFALEMRERFQQMRGRPFNMLPTESLVEGDSAAVKCDDPKESNLIYLVLFFTKTTEGWKNYSLRNSPPTIPLAQHFADFKAQQKTTETTGASTEKSKTDTARDHIRAVALFHDIEEFGHEFDAAFSARNLTAAKTGVRRLTNLLTDFNAVMRGTDCEFPAAIFDDIAKVGEALEKGDWDKASKLARHNEEYAARFRAIGYRMADIAILQRLNEDQRAVLEWTDRQFHSFFDARTFEGFSRQERTELEARLLDQLKGPHNREYYTAINSLAALHSTKAIEPLRTIAFDRADKDNRDRWMAIRALGILGDKSGVPELIHLVYHGNVNTHWWAQISLVRLTGQNFGKDWNAWGEWWNKQNGQRPFEPKIIRWWSGQVEPDKLAESLDESDRKFLADIKSQSNAANETGQRNQAQTGEAFIHEQTKLAEAGNFWARFNLWEAFSRGKHDVARNAAEAEKWLSELVKGAYLARFEPVNGFAPQTPKEMFDKFNEHCQLRSGKDSLGGASFFRTAEQDGKLIGSFLTAAPDEFRAALQKNLSLKLISMEKLTPEMFLAHEAAKQESLPDEERR